MLFPTANNFLWEFSQNTLPTLPLNRFTSFSTCLAYTMIREKSTIPITPTSRIFVCSGAISAATAYFLAAYGKHVVMEANVSAKSKQVYQTGKHFHYISSIALMLVPLSNIPLITGVLFLSGLFLFSGTCYLHALLDSSNYTVITPIGSMMSVGGWLTFLL